MNPETVELLIVLLVSQLLASSLLIAISVHCYLISLMFLFYINTLYAPSLQQHFAAVTV